MASDISTALTELVSNYVKILLEKSKTKKLSEQEYQLILMYLTNKRIDDVVSQIKDAKEEIKGLRDVIDKKFEEARKYTEEKFQGQKSEIDKKIEELRNYTDKKIDDLKSEMNTRFNDINKRIDDLNARINDLRNDINARFDQLISLLSKEEKS